MKTSDSQRFKTMGSAPAADSLEFERVAATAASALFGDAHDVAPARLGRFVLGRHLGSGGMGTVYEAHDPELGRMVALKVVPCPPEHEGGRPETTLLAEARAAAKVDHPNVVKVFESGFSDNRVFIAMERVEGMDLRTWLRVDQPARAEVLEVFARIARGLQAVHAAGIVHRDFKPSNVLIARVDGRLEPRVVDFGLAMEASAELGRRAGTLAYMPPEQLAGKPVSAAADQFAFFVTLKEALGGTPPPLPTLHLGEGDGHAAQARTRWLESWRSAHGSRRLQRLIRQGTDINPLRRMPSMEAVAEELEQIPKRRRRTRLLAVGSTLGVCGALGLGLALRDPCAASGEAWRVVYDQQTRDGVRTKLEEVAPAYAAESFEAVDGLLREWGDAWSASSRHACLAGQGFLASNRKPNASVVRCLEHRLTEAEAVVERLGALSPTTAPQAADAVANLTRPDWCMGTNPDAAESSVPVPESSVRALAKARAHLMLSEIDEAQVAMRGAQALLEPTAPPELRVGTRLTSAVLQDRQGEHELASEGLRESFNEAVALGLDAHAAQAATELVWTSGYELLDLPMAEHWNELGHSFEQRADLGPSAASRRLDRLGAAQFKAGKYERAYQTGLRALELATEVWGEGSPVLFTHLLHTGAAADRIQGMRAQANEHTERALALAERVYGPNHPTVALALTNRRVPLEPEPCRAALPDIQRALEIKRRVFGEGSAKLTSTLNKLANCQGVLDADADAIATLRDAIAIIESTSGPQDPRIAAYSVNIARSLLKLKTATAFDDAEAAFARALAIDRSHLGADHWELLYSLIGLLDVDLEYRERIGEKTSNRLGEADRLIAFGEAADAVLVAMAQLAHVRYAMLEGDRNTARTWLDTAAKTLDASSGSPEVTEKLHSLRKRLDAGDG